MADFATSVAKKAVEGTLSRVQSAIDEENRQKATAQKDLVFITGEFRMMQAYLEAANKERARNRVVKAWVRQIRDLAFDVEDCVEFVVHMDNDTAWSWVWRMVPSCMAPRRARELDMAVGELKLLRTRVEEVSQRNTRYNLISSDDDDDDDSGGSMPTALPAKPAGGRPASTVGILTGLWAANKKRCSFGGKFRDLLTIPGSDLRVISMWRSAGADGAAGHIIETAYCDQKICREFEVRARVKLTTSTQHPFDPDEFLKSLRNQLRAQELEKVLSKRYLIVVEDISSSLEWDFITMHLPDHHNGSRVVISTEQLGIALSCTGEPYLVSELRQFPDDRFLHVFFKDHISLGELFRELGKRRIISLREDGGHTSRLVTDLIVKIRDQTQGFMGEDNLVAYNLFDVPRPFNSEVFKICESVVRKFYRGDTWFIVIDDLQSKEEWDLVRATLMPIVSKSCIVTISNKEDVVAYCKEQEAKEEEENDDDDDDDNDNHNDDDDDFDFGEEEEKDYSSIRYFTEDDLNPTELFRQLGLRRVVSFWGASSDTSNFLKTLYMTIRDPFKTKRINFDEFCWLDVPRPFSSDVFTSWRMVGSFGQHEKQKVRHPVPWVRCACLVVINGLKSKQEWDEIKDTFVSKINLSCIVVIAHTEEVAEYCADVQRREISDKHKKANNAIHPFSLLNLQGSYSYVYNLGKGCDAYWTEDSGISLSKRMAHAFFNPSTSTSTSTSRSTSSIPFIVCQNEVRRCIHYIHLQNSDVNSVWGTIGVGKSAVVRCSYYAEIAYSLGMTPDDYIPMAYFHKCLLFPEKPSSGFEKFGWVDVPDPFDLAEFSRRLFLDFHSLDCTQMEKAAAGIIQGLDPAQGCYEILHKYRCLVVVDGVRSAHDWDTIREAFFPKPVTEKSSVVVITNEEHVARHCVNKVEARMIKVKALEHEDALCLFKKIAVKNEYLTSGKLKNAEAIVPKCGGLPKIIAAVGKASSSFWENTNDDLVVKLQTDKQFHHLKGLLSWMHSYFDACPDSVKPFIFYLSVFPTNCKIWRGRLLRRCIAEGYSRNTTDRTAKENAERVFSELVDLGIIQQTQEVSAMCQMNGFFREYIISQPMEDNLVFALEGHCKLNLQRNGQHLTIMENWDREQKNVFDRTDVSRLRSLTVFGKWKSFFVSDKNKMKRIRVLDLEGTLGLTDGELDRIFRELLSLKFISLRRCREICCLPDSLGGLRQLETLDVRDTSIVTLPPAIIKLKKIQYIQAGATMSTYEEWRTTSTPPSQDNNNGGLLLTSQPSETATPPEAEGSDGVAASPAQATIISPDDDGRHDTWPILQPNVGCSTSRLLRSRFPKFPHVSRSFCCMSRGKPQHENNNGGVEVPAGIEEMTALQTLGAVNANSAAGRDFLEKLPKSTQLVKLAVCGINGDNWQQFCSGLSDKNCHLESLSVQFDTDCMDDSFKPPKTLKSLKLYGPIINKLPEHMKELVDLNKLDIETTISNEEDALLFFRNLGQGPILRAMRRLCVKTTKQVCKLDFSSVNIYMQPQVFKIDCSSGLEVNFGNICQGVKVLIIHCSSAGPYLRFNGLKQFRNLKMVYLKGFCHEELEEYLRQQLSDLYIKPVLKLVPQPSS